MFAIPKSDALDILLFGIGLRITQLAKLGDPKFKSLLDNRNFTIQMGSEAQDIYRTFSVENGRFSQREGKTDSPTLTIDFKDSMTGAKLLTKGDATAFMMGIQNGEVKMSGDYSLLMWFNQVAKHIVPKIPEQFQPAVEAAKPLITKATPIAKELCDKGMALLAGFGLFGASKAEHKSEKSEKDVTDANKDEKIADTKAADTAKSLVDTAKEKLNDVKADVEEKVDELKEKFDDVKAQAEDKFDEVKSKAEDKVETLKSDAKDTLDTAKAKADDLKVEAKDKLDEVRTKAEEKVEAAKDKADDLKKDAVEKTADIKADMKSDVEDIKEVANDKLDTAKEKFDEIKTQAAEKTSDVKNQASDKVETVKEQVAAAQKTTSDKLEATNEKVEEKTDTVFDKSQNTIQAKLDELKTKAEADKIDSLTPALQKSHELEEKHAGEKVIADNVTTEAVKDDKSPVTNITVTRATDNK